MPHGSFFRSTGPATIGGETFDPRTVFRAEGGTLSPISDPQALEAAGGSFGDVVDLDPASFSAFTLGPAITPLTVSSTDFLNEPAAIPSLESLQGAAGAGVPIDQLINIVQAGGQQFDTGTQRALLEGQAGLPGLQEQQAARREQLIASLEALPGAFSRELMAALDDPALVQSRQALSAAELQLAQANSSLQAALANVQANPGLSSVQALRRAELVRATTEDTLGQLQGFVNARQSDLERREDLALTLAQAASSEASERAAVLGQILNLGQSEISQLQEEISAEILEREQAFAQLQAQQIPAIFDQLVGPFTEQLDIDRDLDRELRRAQIAATGRSNRGGASGDTLFTAAEQKRIFAIGADIFDTSAQNMIINSGLTDIEQDRFVKFFESKRTALEVEQQQSIPPSSLNVFEIWDEFFAIIVEERKSGVSALGGANFSDLK